MMYVHRNNEIDKKINVSKIANNISTTGDTMKYNATTHKHNANVTANNEVLRVLRFTNMAANIASLLNHNILI